MLRRVAFTELPRDPQSVRVLHHSRSGVVIAAVAYKAEYNIITSTTAATTVRSSSDDHRHRRPLFFTVVEMAAPNERGLPLRVVHVRVPKPYTVVNSLTLLRSNDGEDVYVVVQAAELCAPAHQRPALSKSVTTYVYRRQVVEAKEARAKAETGNPNDEEHGEVDTDDDLVSSPTAAQSDEDGAYRVRYQRLPRTVTDADDSPWTAAAAFSTTEPPIFGAIMQHTTTLDVGESALTLLTASHTNTAGADTEQGAGLLSENQLQLWTLTGTRVALTATWKIPALNGFPISEILTIAGTQNAALVRCHNSLFEVDLAAVRSACAHFPHTVTTNTFLTRAWRLSPHIRLTACAVKDTLLFAGTEDGSVVVWDLRKPTSSAISADEKGGVTFQQPQISASINTPITGLYAPYATGFITCDASGGVQDWRERAAMAEEDENANAVAREGNNNRNGAAGTGPCGVNATNEENFEHGVLRDVAGLAANAASRFPYCARAPAAAAATANGSEGCVAMDGHDNFAAVVGECGRLSLYFCDWQ